MAVVVTQQNNEVIVMAGSFCCNIQGGGKVRPQTHGMILSNLNHFKNIFSGRFRCKFAVKSLLKIPLSLAHLATLPCD